MSKIKHTFQAGRMNKDLDERLVPNGEYRDALNVEVRTSDGDDGGVLQMISGTKLINPIKYDYFLNHPGSLYPTVSWSDERSSFVGSVADEKTNKAYFFIASPRNTTAGSSITGTKVWKDMIVEYNATTKVIRPVVTDIHTVHFTASDLGTYDGAANPVVDQGSLTGYNKITVSNADKLKLIRPGMTVKAYPDRLVNKNKESGYPIVRQIDGNDVIFDRELIGSLDGGDTWEFKAEPVLGFHSNLVDSRKSITGINIIDNLLFWTCNRSEPKKINIRRCIAGTMNFSEHSKLFITDPYHKLGTLSPISDIDSGTDDALKKEHITVVKRAPKTAPKLLMSTSPRSNINGSIYNHKFVHTATTVVDGENVAVSGDPFDVGHFVDDVHIVGTTYYPGDTLILDSTSKANIATIRVKVVEKNINFKYKLQVLSVDTETTSSNTKWKVRLELDRPLFELKFGRFSYRYKYEDGEYSSFAPWSEVAFLPGVFDYSPMKGYNLGMVNNIRELKITDFVVDDSLRPDDVVAVDVLYKDTTSPNVYTVKTIERGKHPEWNDDASYADDTGVLNITSEMIHNALPASQALRAWDNVPRRALAQEVTGNRVVYGNYLQNYDVKQPIIIDQGLIEIDHPGSLAPKKSIKSARKYKIGVVFGDKYGRETPVMGMGGLMDLTKNYANQSSGILKADVFNPKKNAHIVTKLSAKQQWGIGDKTTWAPSSWMDYFKYYIKETTNEYYNMSMDRWYNAEDGNIWLSFQSADRNKVDEDTYLILKNAHGSEEPVLQEARYKILAIENEAPDYIKTTERILGELRILSEDNNNLSGIPTASYAAFAEGTFGYDQVFKDIEFKGTGYARIKGVYSGNQAFSKWVKIARMNDSTNVISTVEPFGESANMINVLHADAEFHLQVKDEVVENKPEFDGRFFIKIYKDSVLSEHVLIQSADDVEYFEVNTFEHAFISSSHYNPAKTSGAEVEGEYTNTTWNDAGGSTFGNGDVHEMGTCGHNVKSEKFWKNHGSNGFSEGSKWFLDQAKALSEDAGYNPWGYGNRKGLYSRSGVSGKSAMEFSIRNNKFPTSGPAFEFKQIMTTPGTFFRFRNDPNKIVYEIKGSYSGGSFSKNWHRENVLGIASTCPACNQKDKHCNRKTFATYFTRADNPIKGVDTTVWDPRGELKHTGKSTTFIDIVEPNYTYSENIRYTESNAMWETEPKEDVGLDLYYEATSAIPVKLTEGNNTSFAPRSSKVTCERTGVGTVPIGPARVNTMVRDVLGVSLHFPGTVKPLQIGIGDILAIEHSDGTVLRSKVVDHQAALSTYHSDYKPSNEFVISTVFNGTAEATISGAETGFDTTGNKIWEIVSVWDTGVSPGTFVTGISGTTLTLNQATIHTGTVDTLFREVTGYYKLDTNIYKYTTDLSWFNCYSFGNGLESDRIRDDFNAPTIDNGCKVSTVLDSYGEERRGSGLIYSGIYNSTSGVNNLNEFNMAEKITKDLNPSYGSIQVLKSRDTNLVTFCEDKVLQILANKDALYNADGSRNVTASSAVLGDARGFAGDYGISLNPESLAVDGYRMYFTDKQRGKVLRLSQDGLTPISEAGMSSWFRDNLRHTNELLGTYDEVKNEYNISLRHKSTFLKYVGTVGYNADITVSFSEASKGWVSFKSFVPQTGLSINSEYITASFGGNTIQTASNYTGIYKHHDPQTRNNVFYGEGYESTVDILFNDNPSSIKSFSSLSYEGSKSRVPSPNGSDYIEPWRLEVGSGWDVTSISTDKQQGYIPHFVEKEGKWFNYIFGEETTLSNLDPSEFTVQGLGKPTSLGGDTTADDITITITSDDCPDGDC